MLTKEMILKRALLGIFVPFYCLFMQLIGVASAQVRPIQVCALYEPGGPGQSAGVWAGTSFDYPGILGSAETYCVQKIAKGVGQSGSLCLAHAALLNSLGYSRNCNPDPFAWPSNAGECANSPTGPCEVCSDGSCATVASHGSGGFSGGAALCLSSPKDTSPICHTDLPVYVIRQLVLGTPLIAIGGPAETFSVAASGLETGAPPLPSTISVNDSSVELDATTSQNTTIYTEPQSTFQNGGYTYVSSMTGPAIDDLGNAQTPQWTYEESCQHGCRLTGGAHATFAVQAGRKYTFYLHGWMVVPSGADVPQYTVQAR